MEAVASIEKKKNEMNMQRDTGHMSLRRNRGNNVQSPKSSQSASGLEAPPLGF